MQLRLALFRAVADANLEIDMFITDNASYDSNLSNLAGEQRHAWKAVSLSINSEWFFVTYSLQLSKGKIVESIMLSRPLSELVKFIEEQSGRASLIEIQLVSPPYMNRTSCWQMDQLVRTWRKASDPIACVYELVGGQQYCNVSREWDLSEYDLEHEFLIENRKR